MSGDAQELIVSEQASAAKERGDIDQARAGYAQVIASGQARRSPRRPDQPRVPGARAGPLEEARTWLGQAVATGHPFVKPRGLIALAEMDARAGRLETARRQYAEAAAADDPDAVKAAQAGLDSLRKTHAYLDELLAAAEQRADEFGRLGTADALRQAREAAMLALQAQQPLQEIPANRMNLAAVLLDLYRGAHDEGFLRAATACVSALAPEAALLPAPARPVYLTLRGDVQLTRSNAMLTGYQDAEVTAAELVDDAISSLIAAAKQVLTGAVPSTGSDSPLYMYIVSRLAAAVLAKRERRKTEPDLAPYADMLRGVLRNGGGDSGSRAQCAWLLGRMLWDTYAETGLPTLLTEATQQFQAAAGGAPADDPRRTPYQLWSAAATAWLARETQDRPDPAQARRTRRRRRARRADRHGPGRQLPAHPSEPEDRARPRAVLRRRL